MAPPCHEKSEFLRPQNAAGRHRSALHGAHQRWGPLGGYGVGRCRAEPPPGRGLLVPADLPTELAQNVLGRRP